MPLPEPNPKIQKILIAFTLNDGVYKRHAVDEAIALKEEITPHLIQILEDAIIYPLDYINTDTMAHIYAVMLLGYFRETRAHEVIIKLFSLPQLAIETLYGDLITEDLAMILYRTCGGSVDQIKSLVLNKNAYEYCRTAASGALVYAVGDGLIPREEALNFLESLFTGTEAEPDSVFWSSVATDIGDLYPAEMMEVIKRAFDQELIDPMFVHPEYFEEILQEGQEKAWARLQDELRRRSFDDIHARMSWWAMFDAPEEPVFRPKTPLLPSKKSQNHPKAQKKSRRKMAKASQKKNRRRR